MSVNKIQQLVGSLAKAVENNERLATPLLAVKLAKCAAAYPQDKTLGSMSRIISDMNRNNNLFISRADFKSLSHKLYSNNTKFAEFFQEELGEAPAEPTVITYQRDESLQNNPYEVGDQVLANALESVFDKHSPLKMYSQPLANKALKSVGSTLDVWNLRPIQLTVRDGNDKFIVIQADYDTPKGVTSFYVPVEIAKSNVIDPEVFMGNSGPEDLNHVTIKAYLTQQAGTKTKIGATDILSALTAASIDHREVSAAELAVTRLNATRQGKSEFFQGQIVGQKMAEASKKDVELPKSNEFESFEKKFSSALGIAEFHLGAKIVNAAREHVAREICGFGFKNPQVVVQGFDKHAKTDNSTIYLNVSLNDGRLAFSVPVRVANGKIVQPAILLCNGGVDSFSQGALERLIENNTTDFKAAAVASSQYGLKPSEVITNLRQALVDGNHAKAEDALNVLTNCGDKKAYDTGFQLYMTSLAGVKTAQTKCSKMIKSAVSEYPVCSHTGLSINKVYQDKDGNCRPLFRKGMDETYEGASFINAKIFG